MEAWETFEHAGLTVSLVQDEDPQSPGDWDSLGTLAQFGRVEWRGFETSHTGAEEMLERRGVAGLCRWLRLAHGLHVVPFDVIEHGPQATLRPCSESDDNCTGYAWTDAARCEALGVKPDNAEEALAGELRDWAAYFEGHVTGVVVTDNGEHVASVWGFYPDNAESGDGFEHARAEGRALAQAEADARAHALAHGIPTVAS